MEIIDITQFIPEKEKNRMIREYFRCDDSPSHFATKHCKTLDVEMNEERLFPDYPYLIEFLEANKDPQNCLIEKSRQMLASWLLMVLCLHDITFKDNVADFITSRKEFLVDDGGSMSTPNSLMGRIRFIWERLPDYLKMPLEFSFLRIKNPENGSYIIGESSNPNAGRSGTWHRAIMDETALIPKSESVFGSIIQACKKGTYMNSTPYGRGGCFPRLRFDKQSTFRKDTFHWRIHPKRNESWYNEQCRNMTQDQIARELDISYEKSVAGQIWHMFDYSAQVGNYGYDQNLPLYCGWDFGIGNPTAILWIQERPIPNQDYPEITIIAELESNEKSPPFYAEHVRKKPYKEAMHYGDPAGKQRQVNMKSWISWLGELGIHINVKYGVKISDSIMAAQRLVPHVRIDKSCLKILECIPNYKHPTDDQGLVIGDGYEENWATHIMKAFEYYAVNRFPIRKAQWRAL